jgi:hypothetical protein
MATEAAADTPMFNCYNDGGDLYLGHAIPATEKSTAQKAKFFRCFKV